jgi:spore germination cell wall hydrolase CwlJ-like protein
MRLEKLLLPFAIMCVTVAVMLSTNTITANEIKQIETQKPYTNIQLSQLTPSAQKQVECLADNIYWESAFEPTDGRVGVALVTLNRVQDKRFPENICSVVKQKVKSTCQFSWFCENKYKTHRKDDNAYDEAVKIALYVYVNYEKLIDITDGALFYHANYVNPRWKGVEQTVVLGRHIFYKERVKTNDAKNELETRRGSITPLVLLADGGY